MLGRLSLRARLLLGVLLLAAFALASADVATYTSLRSFLVARTDGSLEAAHGEVAAALFRSVPSAQGGEPSSGADRSAPLPSSPSGGQPPSAGGFRSLIRSLPGLFVEIRSPAGKVLFSGQVPQFSRTTAAPPPPLLPARISLPAAPSSGPDRARYFTAPARSGSLRYRVRASIEGGSTSMLIVATSLVDVDGALHRLFLVELLVTGAVLAAIVLVGAWVVRLGLRPLEAIGSTAAAIAAGDLSRRVERAEERTEVGRLGVALNAMLGQIEAAFRAREASEERLRRFVADASHELRTPLAAVRAYAELFARGADRHPDDLARSMAGIGRESERMSVLVEDLLLLARLDDGRPLEREPVDLEQVVAEAVETARTLDPERAIELELAPARVLGDRGRLRQIVDNLLSNARAHTPARAPVHVSLTRRDGSALVEVADAGPGLSAEELEQVFERFYRTDSSRSRVRGGVGLGLSIVAAVAEAHGGSVAAESQPGRGSVFRIALPLLDADAGS